MQITPALRKSHTANRAAIDAAYHYDRNHFVRQSREEYVRRFGDPVDFVCRAANALSPLQRVCLAQTLIDGLDDVQPDDWNGGRRNIEDLKTEADAVLGELAGVLS